MKIPFVKVHTCGNDYIISHVENETKEESQIALKMCQRRFCVGADAMVFVSPTKNADGEIRLYNSDGTRSKSPQNAVGCVAKTVWNKTGKERFSFLCDKEETDVSLVASSPEKEMFEIGLKKANFEISGLRLPKEEGIKTGQVRIQSDAFAFFCVEVGKETHAVTFDCDEYGICDIATEIRKNRIKNVSVEKSKIITPNRIRTEFYQKQNGNVMSSVCGVCAVGSVAQKRDLCIKNGYITFEINGGWIYFRSDKDGNMYVLAECEKVYESVYEMNEELL